MNLNYISLGRKLAVISIVCLSAMAYYGEALARGSGGNGNGGVGNGNGRGAGNELGSRSEITGAMNASDTARDHASHDSAVILADPDHFADGHTH